jgi:hypothetical protein
MNALDTYLKANGGLERKVIVTLAPREVDVEGPFGFNTTKTIEFDRLIVWADDGMLDTFKAISGVMYIDQDKTAKVRYVVSVDPRYSTKWVIAEIEAAAQLHEPKQLEPEPTTFAGHHDAWGFPLGDSWKPTFRTDDTTNT